MYITTKLWFFIVVKNLLDEKHTTSLCIPRPIIMTTDAHNLCNWLQWTLMEHKANTFAFNKLQTSISPSQAISEYVVYYCTKEREGDREKDHQPNHHLWSNWKSFQQIFERENIHCHELKIMWPVKWKFLLHRPILLTIKACFDNGKTISQWLLSNIITRPLHKCWFIWKNKNKQMQINKL